MCLVSFCVDGIPIKYICVYVLLLDESKKGCNASLFFSLSFLSFFFSFFLFFSRSFFLGIHALESRPFFLCIIFLGILGPLRNAKEDAPFSLRASLDMPPEAITGM